MLTKEGSLLQDINVQDYSVGLAYAFPVNELFSVGLNIKYVHEDLGSVPIAVSSVETDSGTVYTREDRQWKLDHWGFDFGAFYNIGYKDLVLGVAFQNYSSNMKYWTEEFQMPLTIRVGLAMDILKFWNENDENFELNTAIDLLHPIDYTERIHVGTELVFKKMFAIRGGYKFNYDIENYSFGLGFKFGLGDFGASLDYAYTNAEFFGNINRLSLNFTF